MKKTGGVLPLTQRGGETIHRLLSIWDTSVAATHDFLSASDMEAIRPDVAKALAEIEGLYGFEAKGALLGFLGVEGHKIEMLFVDANARGQGVGRKLAEYATGHCGAKYVDVNEQNDQGIGFYRRLGFKVVGRSALDGQGRPFPLLHLELFDAQ